MLYRASGRADEDHLVIYEPNRDEPRVAITVAPIKGREAIFEKILSGARHIKAPRGKSENAFFWTKLNRHEILSQ